MAKRGRRTTKKPKANGDSSGHLSDGLPPDEVFQRHLAKIRPAVGKLNKAVEAARRQRAVVSDLYDRAGKDGCNRKGFTNAIAIMAKPADEVAIEQRTTGRILRLAEHALVNDHGLFPDLPFADKPPSPYQAGLIVGRAAGSIDECPYKPGSEDFIEWRDGYEAGQRVNRDSLRETSAHAGPS
jgi:hypothetical protein